ncbi:MAG: GrpB family protein [Trueperaceae bacterium]
MSAPGHPIDLRPYDPAWPARYERERAAIAAALGALVDGGALDGIEHVGSTSVPGLAAKPCIDIMARVHPYPPAAERVAALEAIGFTHHGENGLPGRTYFTKGPHEVHLHVVGFDSEHWQRHLLFRDYLRANVDARDRYQARKVDLAKRFGNDRDAYQNGKSGLIEDLGRRAEAWHLRTIGFAPVRFAARELAGLDGPGGVRWAIASGWALDLFLGAPSRFHEDLDVEIARADQLAVQKALLQRGWRLDQVVEGGVYAPWPEGEAVRDGVHQVHGRRDGAFVDLLLAPRTAEAWAYRRDESVTLPLRRAIRTTDERSGGNEDVPTGIPYLAPEAVLLFKSRSSRGGMERPEPRAKDAFDFERVLPRLASEQRAWLSAALERVHGGHPWIERLRDLA